MKIPGERSLRGPHCKPYFYCILEIKAKSLCLCISGRQCLSRHIEKYADLGPAPQDVQHILKSYTKM